MSLYFRWCEKQGYRKSEKKAEKIYEYAKGLVCTLPKDDTTQMLVKNAVKQVNAISETLEFYRNQMNMVAMSLPEYEMVLSMKGLEHH